MPQTPARETQPPTGPNGKLRRLLWLIPIGALANLAYSLIKTDLGELPALLLFKPSLLALAMGLVLLPWFLATIRLRNWLRFLGRKESLRETFQFILAGELGAAVTPTTLGGAPAKVALLASRGMRVGHATSVALLGTCEDAVFTILALPLGVILTGAWRVPIWQGLQVPSGVWIGLLAAVVVAVPLVVWIWRRSGRQGPRAWWRRFRREMVTVAAMVGRRGLGTFALNVLLSAVQWSSRYFVIAALVAGLGIESDALRLAVTQWMCLTAMTFVPTPGATGGAEAIFLMFYTDLVPAETLPVVMVAWRFVTFYFLTTLAMILYLVPARKNGSRPAPTPSAIR